MNKKLLVGALAIALIAVFGASVFSDTWLDTNLTLTASTAATQSMQIFVDCAATTPATSHNFGAIAQGNMYEWTIYVLNTGSEGMWISYLPTSVSGVGGQTALTIKVLVLQYGVPCEMTDNNIPLTGTGVTVLPFPLPEKNTAVPSQGFYLMPTKMIKLDIQLTAVSVNVGAQYTIPFEIAGVNVVVQL